MNAFAKEFRDFWAKPFSADMDPIHWFLFIGMLLVIVVLWNVILRLLLEAVRGNP